MTDNPNAPLLDQHAVYGLRMGDTTRLVLGTVVNTGIGVVLGGAAGLAVDALNGSAPNFATPAAGASFADWTQAAGDYAKAAGQSPYVQGGAAAGGLVGMAAGAGALGKWTKKVQDERAVPAEIMLPGH